LFEGDRWTLEKILSNKDPNQFFEMLPSRTIAAIVTDIESMRGFDKVIKGLPPNTVSVFCYLQMKKIIGTGPLIRHLEVWIFYTDRSVAMTD
jgi:hypothetical protein